MTDETQQARLFERGQQIAQQAKRIADLERQLKQWIEAHKAAVGRANDTERKLAFAHKQIEKGRQIIVEDAVLSMKK